MAPFELMPGEYPAPANPDYADAVWACALLTVDHAGLGGMLIRARFGEARDNLLNHLHGLAPAAPWKKMPLSIEPGRLFGGLDLAATLGAGKQVFQRGLLQQVSGGTVIMAMAERVSTGIAARIAARIDDAANFSLIALDEGLGEDETAPTILQERLAFTLNETILPPSDAAWPDAAQIAHAKTNYATVATSPDAIETLCRFAALTEIASPRAVLFALRAARAAAALCGRSHVTDEDITLAIRLVLLPRAQAMPNAAGEQQDETPQDNPEQPSESDTPDDGNEDSINDDGQDITTEATRIALPTALLESLKAGQIPRRMARGGGQSGKSASLSRGRPAGVRPGRLGHGARLSVIETLRAAIPWQSLRRSKTTSAQIIVRLDDFRILRFKERAKKIAIFAVDASGSAALNRLAEAKGAVQLLLADCYVRRDQVALLAFRGQGAECLLPPTGALARARRGLAGLPGGGPTPLATGIDAARILADAQRRKGMQPLLVLLTDGGANIARNGKPGRAEAGNDALAAARLCRAAGFAALVVDTAPRPNAFVARLAMEMGARYLPLPYADSAALSRAVQQGSLHDRRAA